MPERVKIVHDSRCQEPLNQHIGNEWCIQAIEEKPPEKEKEIRVAHYKQGPQGNSIPDLHADYLQRYGPDSGLPLGSPFEDQRDNRDPAAVGMAYLARANGSG